MCICVSYELIMATVKCRDSLTVTSLSSSGGWQPRPGTVHSANFLRELMAPVSQMVRVLMVLVGLIGPETECTGLVWVRGRHQM